MKGDIGGAVAGAGTSSVEVESQLIGIALGCAVDCIDSLAVAVAVVRCVDETNIKVADDVLTLLIISSFVHLLALLLMYRKNNDVSV